MLTPTTPYWSNLKLKSPKMKQGTLSYLSDPKLKKKEENTQIISVVNIHLYIDINLNSFSSDMECCVKKTVTYYSGYRGNWEK